MNQSNAVPEKQDSIALGALGAFLFSLVGGGLWVFLYCVLNIIAGVSGFIAVFLAVIGYKLLGKKLSKKGTVISVAISVLVIVIAWYLSLAISLTSAFNEIGVKTSLSEVIKDLPIFLSSFEIWGDAIKDLLIGLAFCALASFSTVRNTWRTLNQANGTAVDVHTVGEEASCTTPTEETEKTGKNAESETVNNESGEGESGKTE